MAGHVQRPRGRLGVQATIDDSWDENYGENATRNGNNIGLSPRRRRRGSSHYSHQTHWVADNRNKVIAVAPGSFQSELGCPGDWQPGLPALVAAGPGW